MREELLKVYDWRSEGWTKAQHRKQREHGWNAKHDEWWVHDEPNFAWGFPYANLHRAMVVDILHRLFKGVLMHAVSWIDGLLEDKMSSMTSGRMK